MKKTSFLITAASVIILSIVLTSCGGGGGGGGSTGWLSGIIGGANNNTNPLEGTWWTTIPDNNSIIKITFIFDGSNITYKTYTDDNNFFECTGTYTEPSSNKIVFNITNVSGKDGGNDIPEQHKDQLKTALNTPSGYTYTIHTEINNKTYLTITLSGTGTEHLEKQ